ncbi:MAG TPA: two-component regulator propeller domain-containing protein, partial [Acidobacteriota bacterium]|nr:two-component regulator propeller domain-containing protein [Acidobacteriota bacterium]
MSFFPRSIVTFLLPPLLLVADAAAATFLSDGYAVRVWQTEDGLPQNLVTSAVQTRDGYLWLGTHGGLARFDGERFQTFNSVNTPELVDRRIVRLFEDDSNTLWIGHESGAISRYRDGKFDAFAPSSGAENDNIIGLGSDAQGRMWAMRQSGVVDSLADGRRIPSLISPELPGIMGWSRSPSGSIWVIENGRVAHLDDGALRQVSFAFPYYESTGAHVAASANGGIWVLRDDRILRWVDGKIVEDRGMFPWPPGSRSCCLELRDGTLAVGTIYSGLYLVFGDGRPPVCFDRSKGLPQNWIRFLYEDREGNLWAGTGSAGVVSIHSTAFSVLNPPDQWKGCTVVAVAPGRDGSLWIATDGAGIYRHNNGEWSHYGEAEGLGNIYTQAVTETPAGEIWAGSFWWGGPYRLENGRFVHPPHVDPRTSPVLSLLPLDGDRLLVGTREGLLELKDNRSTWLLKSPEGSDDDVTAIAQDRDGAIWCGFARSGVARLADGKVTAFRRPDGLASDAVQCVFADDDGSVWIGTADNGLSRFKDGHFSHVKAAQGLADEVISHILDDGRGYLWLSTHHGLQRIAKTELNRCADGLAATMSSQTYDRGD